MRKLFVDFPIIAKTSFILTAADSHHILQVLRTPRGQQLIVTDNTGCTYVTILSTVNDGLAVMEPITPLVQHSAPIISGRVYLAAGLLKSDKFEWVLQKAAEIGADCIIPVQMTNCVVKCNQSHWESKKKRWIRILLEAAKQCGRTQVPELLPLSTIHDLTVDFGKVLFIVPYENEHQRELWQERERFSQGDVLILIGPEGGFTPTEIKYIEDTIGDQCCIVSLGANILRAETAALTTLSIVQYERGFCKK
jgi:16S rRNA (uracil1498-N3)-methyltransferase